MSTARIIVPTIALSAGGVAAYPASGSHNKSLPTEPVVRVQTVDVLIAKSDIGFRQSVAQRQTWPATTASNSFIRRNERPDTATEISPETGSLALRSMAGLNAIKTSQSPKRGDSVNVAHYGVSTPTRTLK